MEKTFEETQNNSQTEDEFTCPSCNRPLITERGIGFGAEGKNKPCICLSDKQKSIGRIGWGN